MEILIAVVIGIIAFAVIFAAELWSSIKMKEDNSKTERE